MHESNRIKLLGRYRTPRFRCGDVVTCELRGEVKIVGLTAAHIPWPKCRPGKRSRAIILCGALVEAVRRESAKAVAYWWGVGKFTVWKWRKALGVDRLTDGTSALFSRWAPETLQIVEANRPLKSFTFWSPVIGCGRVKASAWYRPLLACWHHDDDTMLGLARPISTLAFPTCRMKNTHLLGDPLANLALPAIRGGTAYNIAVADNLGGNSTATISQGY